MSGTNWFLGSGESTPAPFCLETPITRLGTICVLTPNHDAGIDPVTALVTYRGDQRDLSLLTPRTDISFQEQLDFSTQSRTALQTGLMFELEVPQPITLGTVVVRHHLDLTIDHVFLGR